MRFLQITVLFAVFLIQPAIKGFMVHETLKSVVPYERHDWNKVFGSQHGFEELQTPQNWLPYLIRLCLVFQLALSMFVALVDFYCGAKLLLHDMDLAYWTPLQGYMDGFIFISTMNFVFHFLLMLSVDLAHSACLQHQNMLVFLMTLCAVTEVFGFCARNYVLQALVSLDGYYIYDGVKDEDQEI